MILSKVPFPLDVSTSVFVVTPPDADFVFWSSDGQNMQPYVNGGHMVWQGAFIEANALKTLTVEEVTLKEEKPSRVCPVGCNIQ